MLYKSLLLGSFLYLFGGSEVVTTMLNGFITVYRNDKQFTWMTYVYW